MTPEVYLEAKAWLANAEALLNSPSILVIPSGFYNALMALIEETRKKIAEYERGLREIE